MTNPDSKALVQNICFSPRIIVSIVNRSPKYSPDSCIIFDLAMTSSVLRKMNET